MEPAESPMTPKVGDGRGAAEAAQRAAPEDGAGVPHDARKGRLSLDLTMVFERWKGRRGADDAALAAYLQVSQEMLADLSRQPIPASNDEVHRLCAAYGLTFECLADLLWETASYWRRDVRRSLG